ncbi:ATP-binding cassette domain-containing protein [Frigidibacter albus]
MLLPAIVYSALANLLLLTSPLYMLQVYDRVLASCSEPTLLALSLIAIFLFAVLGILDHVRGRILARAGAALQDQLDQRVFSAATRQLLARPTDGRALSAQRDLEAMRSFLASPAATAILDAPWTPLFLVALFIFHPLLGWFALIGGALLVTVSLLGHWLNRKGSAAAVEASLKSERMADQVKGESEALISMGMMNAAFLRWMDLRSNALDTSLKASDVAGRFSSLIKTFRMLLQSAILGLAAWLVLKGELSGGAMIAGSVLMGRALQPVEQLIGQWAVVARARQGHLRLAALLTKVPEMRQRTELPRPSATLEVDGLTLVPPGEQQAVLRLVSFQLRPGQALGVIGPSGAGKSSLARALSGVWTASAGDIRLGGATLDQYAQDVLGSYIGYLPQRVSLLEGTIAENIARLSRTPDDAKIVAAARQANVHEMILRLPDGYDTQVSSNGGRLSGGQVQRIGLARALYRDPLLLILDEPNSNLDNDGSMALNAAIRRHKEAGGIVLIMAHRPAAIQECDLLLVLDRGVRRAFGPRDEILREMLKNGTELQGQQRPGGLK